MNIFNRLRASISRPEKPSITLGSSITLGLHVVTVEKPIPIEERRRHGKVWYGYWDKEEKVWHWGLQESPYPEDTHYLPVNVELLPVRSFCPLGVEE